MGSPAACVGSVRSESSPALVILLVGNFPVAPMSAILVLIWRRQSRTPWREIGYVRPESWAATAVVGIGFGIALKLVLKTIAMPLLGAPATNDAYRYLVGNRRRSRARST